jgi:hypothetical protein
MKLGKLLAGILPLAAASFNGEITCTLCSVQSYISFALVSRPQHLLHPLLLSLLPDQWCWDHARSIDVTPGPTLPGDVFFKPGLTQVRGVGYQPSPIDMLPIGSAGEPAGQVDLYHDDFHHLHRRDLVCTTIR